jgi:hypothetical protein
MLLSKVNIDMYNYTALFIEAKVTCKKFYYQMNGNNI